MNWGRKPVIVIGHGLRASGYEPISDLLELCVPVLSSWQGADLIDNYHPMYFGRPGIYGQRCANRILYEADQIIAIGNRMSPWQIGHAGLRQEQNLVMVDVDSKEVAKFPRAQWFPEDAAEWCTKLIGGRRNSDDGFIRPIECSEWLAECIGWRLQYPWIESPAHDDANGYINSYRFIERLEPLLRQNEIVVTDVGASMCPVFQALHVRSGQRLMTSGGLGEMGCALPAAIGASFASGKGEVLALVGDGGLMMNLQELQTIVHHRLPIKIIVFENDGYAMIKGTHKNLKMPYCGVNRASGVSMPQFTMIAHGFHIKAERIRNWEDFERVMPQFMELKEPMLMEVRIDPEQVYVPRLQPIIAADGKITPPKFSELSPMECDK
jgi:acetolactate synthase-1/2/3 large subunit